MMCFLIHDTDLACGLWLGWFTGISPLGQFAAGSERFSRTTMDLLFIGTDPVLEVMTREW